MSSLSLRPSLERLESRLVPTTATFIQGLFREVLHREGSAEGVNSWLAISNSGATREQVALGFYNSTERHGIEVHRMYREHLHRDADPAGFANWVSALDHGASLRDVAGAFLLSAEFANRSGDDSGFVEDLYADLLHRTASPSDVEIWKSFIAQQGRAAAVHGILYSVEHAAWEAEKHFREFLGRHETMEHRLSHVNLAGVSDDILAKNFLNSVEFDIRSKIEVEHGLPVRTETEIEIEIEIEHGIEFGHGGQGGDDPAGHH